jgi:cell fate regulator YaaT (PSP1 superfamily)
MGRLGRFAAVDGYRYGRGMEVVCRTRRGLELGEVLAAVASTGSQQADGQLLRRVTPQDQLLAERLERNKHQAFAACQQQLAERGISATLVDVELLFDGKSLFFYFLGDPSPELDALTDELAEVYDSQVQWRQFVDALTVGCGPDCGTEAGEGCGSACTSCSVAKACKARN